MKKPKKIVIPTRTLRSAVYERLYQTNGGNKGLRYDEVLELLKQEFPNCRTTLKGLRWYATTFQKENPEVRMPERPRRSKKFNTNRDPRTA